MIELLFRWKERMYNIDSFFRDVIAGNVFPGAYSYATTNVFVCAHFTFMGFGNKIELPIRKSWNVIFFLFAAFRNIDFQIGYLGSLLEWDNKMLVFIRAQMKQSCRNVAQKNVYDSSVNEINIHAGVYTKRLYF